MTQPVVKISHIRAVGFCGKGVRQFFARHGMDWQTFLESGLPVDHFLATGDAMAIRLAEFVINGQGQEKANGRL